MAEWWERHVQVCFFALWLWSPHVHWKENCWAAAEDVVGLCKWMSHLCVQYVPLNSCHLCKHMQLCTKFTDVLFSLLSVDEELQGWIPRKGAIQCGAKCLLECWSKCTIEVHQCVSKQYSGCSRLKCIYVYYLYTCVSVLCICLFIPDDTFFKAFMTIFLTKGFYEHTLSLEILCFMYLLPDNIFLTTSYIFYWSFFLVYLWPIQCTSDDIYLIFAITYSWNIQCHYLFLYIIWQMVIYNIITWYYAK